MNAQIGINDSAAIAQNGIFARDLAAATYGGSGLGGGASAGAAAAFRPTGPAGGAAAGVAAVVAGVAAGSASAAPSAARRRFATSEPQRCSAVSRALEQMFGDLSHG